MKISGTLNKIKYTVGDVLEHLPDKKENGDPIIYDLKITERRKKRTLDANAYYWALIGKYAEFAQISRYELHNQMLAEYGQDLLINGQPYMIGLKADINYKKLVDLHVRPSNLPNYTLEMQIGVNHGKPVLKSVEYAKFYVLRGSHTYNAKEFARLIEGLINEIKGSDAPIETLTPAELERLKGYAHE